MKYIIKLKSETFGVYYYAGTILKDHSFTANKNNAVTFRSERAAKQTIKFHSLTGVTIITTN